jgi:hypothetical protein
MKSSLNIPSSSALASTFTLLADLCERTPLTSELRLFTYRLVTICVKCSRAKTRIALTFNTQQRDYGLDGHKDRNFLLGTTTSCRPDPNQAVSRALCLDLRPPQGEVDTLV